MPAFLSLLVGAEEHGVARHGAALATAAGWPVLRGEPDLAVLQGADVLVAEVTDRLFGETTEASTARLLALAATVHAAGAWWVVSLHDVPDPADGAVFDRRAAGYRELVAVADGVLVASGVDRARLARVGAAPRRIAVLPLPVPPPVSPPAGGAGATAPGSATVLGFLYPGKGHEEVASALRADPGADGWSLVCVGRPSDGHADLVTGLRARYPRVVVTGFLPDDALAPLLQAATVPVAPNRRVGSSASIATWWAHGRRPLVPDTPLTRELAAAHPDALRRYGSTAELGGALREAREDPASTWLAAPVDRPSVATVAADRTRILRGWFR